MARAAEKESTFVLLKTPALSSGSLAASVGGADRRGVLLARIDGVASRVLGAEGAASGGRSSETSIGSVPAGRSSLLTSI